MNHDDILFGIAVIGAPVTVISCIYQVVSYHWPPKDGKEMEAKQGHSYRPVVINAFLALVVCTALFLDYYNRENTQVASVAIARWGIVSTGDITPPNYQAVVDTTGVEKFADTNRLILIVRNNWANRDAYTDVEIEKSVAYGITAQSIALEAVGSGKIHYLVAPNLNSIQFYIAMIPSNVSPDEITKLADIKNTGGRILAQAGQTVTGGPPPQSQGAPHPPPPH